jgi:ankyrin repeat protein
VLLQKGADKNTRDIGGFTPLLLAVQDGHFDSMQVLLDAGADKNACENHGYTPLLFASQNGHLECMNFFAGRWL